MKKLNLFYGLRVSRYPLGAVFAICAIGLYALVVRAAEIKGEAGSCECPKLACNEECEVQKDLTFYSEKCAEGTRVKSCSRPNCVKLENAPASCGLVKTGSGQSVFPTQTQTNSSRDVASESEQGQQSIGRVKFIEGVAKKVISPLRKVDMNVADEIYKKDHIETDATGKVQIIFNNGSVLNITPSSEIVISEATDSVSAGASQRMVLDLLKGKIRNKVEHGKTKPKYDGEQSYFRVRAGAAVAGVRGTDFVVSIVDDQKEIAAKVETVEGQVELFDSTFKEKVSVAHGETASYVADRTAVLAMSSAASAGASAKIQGHFTPVTQLTEQKIADIEVETGFSFFAKDEEVRAVARLPAKKARDVCDKPKGDINQCQWTCENNLNGEKKCRTDLPQVSCVRRICNANGEWSQSTRLPAAYHEACKGDGPVVKACDY